MSNATGDGGGARRHDGIEDHRASSRSCCTCEPRIPRRRAHTSTGSSTHVQHIRRARAHTGARVHLTKVRARARAPKTGYTLNPGVLYSHDVTRRDARMKKCLEFARDVATLGQILLHLRLSLSRFLYLSP